MEIAPSPTRQELFGLPGPEMHVLLANPTDLVHVEGVHSNFAEQGHVCGPDCLIHSRKEAVAEANSALDAILHGDMPRTEQTHENPEPKVIDDFVKTSKEVGAHICGPDCLIHSRKEAVAEANSALDAILGNSEIKSIETSPIISLVKNTGLEEFGAKHDVVMVQDAVRMRNDRLQITQDLARLQEMHRRSDPQPEKVVFNGSIDVNAALLEDVKPETIATITENNKNNTSIVEVTHEPKVETPYVEITATLIPPAEHSDFSVDETNVDDSVEVPQHPSIAILDTVELPTFRQEEGDPTEVSLVDIFAITANPTILENNPDVESAQPVHSDQLDEVLQEVIDSIPVKPEILENNTNELLDPYNIAEVQELTTQTSELFDEIDTMVDGLMPNPNLLGREFDDIYTDSAETQEIHSRTEEIFNIREKLLDINGETKSDHDKIEYSSELISDFESILEKIEAQQVSDEEMYDFVKSKLISLGNEKSQVDGFMIKFSELSSMQKEQVLLRMLDKILLTKQAAGDRKITTAKVGLIQQVVQSADRMLYVAKTIFRLLLKDNEDTLELSNS